MILNEDIEEDNYSFSILPNNCQIIGDFLYFYKVTVKQKNPQFLEGLVLGGRPDSNRRPPEPQSGVLTHRTTTNLLIYKHL